MYANLLIDKSTIGIYGVSPKIISDVSYEEALKLRLFGVKELFKFYSSLWFTMLNSDKSVDYSLGDINNTAMYLKKAYIFTENQIEELSDDYVENSILFTSTEEIYGINPSSLSSDKYSSVLQIKMEGVTKKLRNEVNTLFESFKKGEDYQKISLQNQKIAFLTKAKKLTQYQIDELKEI